MMEILFHGLNAISATIAAVVALLSLLFNKKKLHVETRPVSSCFIPMGYIGVSNDLSGASVRRFE